MHPYYFYLKFIDFKYLLLSQFWRLYVIGMITVCSKLFFGGHTLQTVLFCLRFLRGKFLNCLNKLPIRIKKFVNFCTCGSEPFVQITNCGQVSADRFEKRRAVQQLCSIQRPKRKYWNILCHPVVDRRCIPLHPGDVTSTCHNIQITRAEVAGFGWGCQLKFKNSTFFYSKVDP